MTTQDEDLKRRLGGEADDLIELLGDPDVDTRGLALGELMTRGKKGLAALHKALDDDNATVRATAAEGLGQMADPSSDDALAKHLDDSDPKVRSQVLSALAALGDDRAIDSLVKAIKDEPDMLHSNFSRASYALIGYGAQALPAVAPLLKDKDPYTRLLAISVFRMVFSQMGDKGPDSGDVEKWLDNYDPDASGSEQEKLAGHLASWARKVGNDKAKD